jgi:transcriptional regulator with XRE-family HTH domain
MDPSNFHDGDMLIVDQGFADRLRRIRQQQGLHQAQLAEKVGLHPNQIGRYERGTSQPSGEALKRLAGILGVSADYLIEGSTEDAAKADFQDRELLRMFKEVERFEEADKAVVKALIDAFIKKRQFVALATETEPRKTG